MPQKREFVKISITPKAENSLKKGHPWVYSDEITACSAPYENGQLVDVFSAKDRFLGTGFINDHSKIRIRIISRNANDRFDRAFYERRLRYAIDYRRTVMGEDFRCCRLIFGEADTFPGLTVDRFENVLVVQILSLAMDGIKDMLIDLLLEILRSYGEQIDVVYERNDVAIRSLEGLSQYKDFYCAPGLRDDTDGHVIIKENGIEYDVDYINGQKTGFFLDQKYNRAAVARLAAGMRVLDCFTHTGAFALNCAAGGAKHVTAVDISADAVEMTRLNARRNGLEDKMSFECRNVFDLLTETAQAGGHPYDFIILDPPAFTKSRATVQAAFRGYKEINLKAMKLLPRGGYLATCSCSHFMTDELFRKAVNDAAADAQVTLRQIENRRQSPDHPIIWNIPETEYLKFYIFQVV